MQTSGSEEKKDANSSTILEVTPSSSSSSPSPTPLIAEQKQVREKEEEKGAKEKEQTLEGDKERDKEREKVEDHTCIPPFAPESSLYLHSSPPPSSSTQIHHDDDHHNIDLHDHHETDDSQLKRKHLRDFVFPCVPIKRTEKLHVPHVWPNIPSTEGVIMWDKFKHHYLHPILAVKHKPTPPLSIRLLALTLMCLMVLGGGMCSASVGAISTIIEKDYNISVSRLGDLYSIYSLPTMFSVFFAGYLSDRIGINICTMAYTGLVVLGSLVAAAGNSFGAMMAGRFLYGLGNESLGVVQSALVSRWFTHDKQLSMSLTMAITLSFYRISSFMSMSTLPTIGNQGLSFCLWTLVMASAFSMACAGGLVYIDYLYKDYLHVPQTGEPISIKDVKKFSLEFWVLSFVTMFFYAAILTYFTLGNNFITAKWGYSLSKAGLISSIIYLTPAVLVPPLGYLTDHIGQRCKQMIISSLLIIPSYLILSYSDISPVLGCLLLGTAYSILPTCLWAGVALIVSPQIVGTAFGVLSALLNTGSFVAPLIITRIQQSTDSYADAYMFLVGLAVLSTILSCWAYYLDITKSDGILERTSVVKERDKKE